MQEIDSKRDPYYNSSRGYSSQDYDAGNRSQSSSLSNDEEFKRKVKALMKSREQFKRQNTELQTQNAELQKQVEDLQYQNSDLQTRNTEYRNQVMTMQKEIVDLKNTTDGRRQQDPRMNSMLDNANRKIESLIAERDALLTDKKDLTARLSKASKPAISREDDLSLKVGRVLIEAQASAQRIMGEAENEANEIRDEAMNVSNAFLKDVDSARAELETMKGSISGISTSLNSRVDVLLGMLYGAQRYFINHADDEKGSLDLDI